MSKEEKLQILAEWQKRYEALDAQLNLLTKSIGCIAGSPLHEAVFTMFEEYTKLIAQLVGDGLESLNWYCYECDMGKSPREAGIKGDMREIKTLNDLLWFIEVAA